MANYLEGSNSASSNYSGSSSAAARSRGRAAAAGGGGGGSKPKALHTEYATGDANWQKPYGSGTDIVFYMQRAG